MSIYSSAVKRPITTIMLFVALMIFGVYSTLQLPIDFYPEVELPAITVMTVYPGANAGDIETNVSKPIEDALNTVDNLEEITSVSRDNMSIVTLQFEWETNLDAAANDIRDAIEFVKDELPEDAEAPIVYKFNSSMMPILFYSVTADRSYESLEKILDEKIINPLNRIEGIGAISMSGAPGREIFIEVDPVKLESYNLSIEAIGGIIQAENLNMPSGNIEMGSMDYQLKVEGEFSDSDELKDVVLGSFNGQTVFLKDIATITDTVRDMSIDERINGKTGLRLMVQKQSGANTVFIANQVNEELAKLSQTLPEDVEIDIIMDSSDFITKSINNLSSTLMWALLAVIVVVLLFLGRWRATFIVVITIPISLISSFIYLKIAGGSINIISLASMSIAIGMVVDDAIVVLENISKHIERGSSPREAAIYATNEVWLAVIVTTLVIVAVFLPLTMVGGMAGVLFKQLGWIVSITTVVSTLIAISLTPMLSSKLLKLTKRQDRFSKLYDSTVNIALVKLENVYGRILAWSLKHKLIIGISAVAIFIGSIGFVVAGKVPFEFMPESDQGVVNATIELQAGMRVDETKVVARSLEYYINANYPEVELISTSAGSDDQGGVSSLFGTSGSHIIQMNIRLVDLDKRDRSCWEIGDDFRKHLNSIPEIVNFTVTHSNGFGMAGGGNNVAVEIYGYDFDETSKVANDIADGIRKIPGARDVQISRDEEKPELKVVFDREKLAQHGLNTAMVSMAVRNRMDGMVATKFREGGDEYDVIVRFDEQYRNSISDIENIILMNSQGQQVRLKEVGQVVEHWSPPNIEHKRRERVVTVTATPYKVALGDLANAIKDVVANVDKPTNVLVDIGGSYEDMQETNADLGLLFVIIVILVYLIMASQFESFKMPFIIMMSIPFAFSGVILALFFTGTTFSVVAILGAILLVGIVIKNGIVLVDYINLMIDRGNPLNEAIIASGKSRLRPVLMTAFTTVFGLLPMALSLGEGAEVWSPMGIAVIGGLVFSTIITLVIIPVLYAAMAREGARARRKKKYVEQFKFMEVE